AVVANPVRPADRNDCEHIRGVFRRKIAINDDATFRFIEGNKSKVLKVFFQPLPPFGFTVQRTVVWGHDHDIVYTERHDRIDVAGFDRINELLPVHQYRIIHWRDFSTHGCWGTPSFLHPPGELVNERSECKPDRAQLSRNERSECKPDRAQLSRNVVRSSAIFTWDNLLK